MEYGQISCTVEHELARYPAIYELGHTEMQQFPIPLLNSPPEAIAEPPVLHIEPVPGDEHDPPTSSLCAPGSVQPTGDLRAFVPDEWVAGASLPAEFVTQDVVLFVEALRDVGTSVTPLLDGAGVGYDVVVPGEAQKAVIEFLDAHGWIDAEVDPISGDVRCLPVPTVWPTSLGAVPGSIALDRPRGSIRTRQNIADLVFRLWQLDALASHWLAHRTGEGDLGSYWSWARPAVEHGATEADAWSYFAATLTEGLAAVRHVVVAAGGLESPPGSSLFTAASVQMHNLAFDPVNDLPVRACANETCQRRFIRQRGTAGAGQYRTKGVLYCSGACATSQAKRMKRRRDAAAVRGEGSA